MDDWLKDGAEIYRRSFATIRAEADLARFPDDVSRVVVRMIHACGMTDLPDDVAFHPDVVRAAGEALRGGAVILCDAQMVASGVTRARLPADNEVKCLLSDPRVPQLASDQGTTRSAAAVDLWGDDLKGAVVAVGNAPTTLFRLLELLDAGAPRPRRSSVCRSASSAPPSRSGPWPNAPETSRTWWCTDAGAAARWPPRR